MSKSDTPIKWTDTKKEIYSAYKELLKKYENLSSQKLITNEKNTKPTPVKQLTGDIFAQIEQLKNSFEKELTAIGAQLQKK